MSHAFKIIPAKPTFGTLRPVGFQSDYIVNKKSKIAYCNSSSPCAKNTYSPNYNQMNLFNNGLSCIRFRADIFNLSEPH